MQIFNIFRFPCFLRATKKVGVVPFLYLVVLFYSFWFSQLKKSAEGESSTNHAVVPTDAPGTASTVDMDTNKHILTSLNNIDQTMGQMAGLIAKFCEDRRPSGQKGSKRSADPPSDTDESESEHEHHPRHSNSKRARENTPSDDDLSLHAQDDLDDEDLKLLTEQSSATGQARETPVPEAKILQDIANGFEDDDATGDKIMQQLADIATKRWGKKLSSDKLKNLLDKYKRPENCVDIKATKVNPEIWNQLNPNKRKVDLQLSNMQQVVRKVTFATLQTTNVLLQNASGSTNSNLIGQSVDVVALLGHVNTQLAQFRREQIKPALKQEYSNICSAEVPLTSQYLFGDEFAKQLRDARESRKISHSVGHSSQQRPYTGNHRSGHQERYNKGPERDFLWKGQHRSHRKKKTQINEKK